MKLTGVVLLILLMFAAVAIGGGGVITGSPKIKDSVVLEKVLTKNLIADELAAVKTKINRVEVTSFSSGESETTFSGKVYVSCIKKTETFSEVYPFSGQIWNQDPVLDDIVTTLPNQFCTHHNRGCIDGNCENGSGVKIENSNYSEDDRVSVGLFSNGVLVNGYSTLCNNSCGAEDIKQKQWSSKIGENENENVR